MRCAARVVLLLWLSAACGAAERSNVILAMADDMGWAQTSYYGHPLLHTPNLDAMAASGLRWTGSTRAHQAVPRRGPR